MFARCNFRYFERNKNAKKTVNNALHLNMTTVLKMYIRTNGISNQKGTEDKLNFHTSFIIFYLWFFKVNLSVKEKQYVYIYIRVIEVEFSVYRIDFEFQTIIK